MSKKKADKKRQLYDNGVLVRLHAPGWSAIKTAKEGVDIVCHETGADAGVVRVSKVIVPGHILKPIKAPVDRARAALKAVGIPWSSSRTDIRGNRKEDARWLVFTKHLPELEQTFRDCRNEREQALEKGLLTAWEDIIAQQRVNMGTLFDEYDFPTKDWIRKKFEWVVEITPLWSLANVEEDLRLKLPRAWAEEQIKVAKAQEGKRISNAVAAVAKEVVEFVGETTKKLREYDPSTQMKDCPDCNGQAKKGCKKCGGTGEVKDGRVGNTFRDKTLYENLPVLRERISSLNEMLGDDALDDTVDALANVEKLLDTVTPEEIRGDDNTREDVAKALDAAVDSARPATDRFAEFMS